MKSFVLHFFFKRQWIFEVNFKKFGVGNVPGQITLIHQEDQDVRY